MDQKFRKNNQKFVVTHKMLPAYWSEESLTELFVEIFEIESFSGKQYLRIL